MARRIDDEQSWRRDGEYMSSCAGAAAAARSGNTWHGQLVANANKLLINGK